MEREAFDIAVIKTDLLLIHLIKPSNHFEENINVKQQFKFSNKRCSRSIFHILFLKFKFNKVVDTMNK